MPFKTNSLPARKICFARIIGAKLCLGLLLCPFPTSGFTVPTLHRLPRYSNPFNHHIRLKIDSRTNHRLQSIEPYILSAQTMLWTGSSNVLPLIILREVAIYTIRTCAMEASAEPSSSRRLILRTPIYHACLCIFTSRDVKSQAFD
jgi:hypothetical protein